MPTGNNYIPVTQAMIDAAKKANHNHPNVHVTAILIIQNEAEPSLTPELSVHPVTAIMPGIPNPVAYHAANKMTILEGSDSSDDKVSTSKPNSVGTFLESVEAVVNTPPIPESPKEISPLIVPHLFWKASTSPLIPCLSNLTVCWIIDHIWY